MTDNLTLDTKSPYWENVLLTDSGFYDPFDLSQPLQAIIDKFAHMVGKPFHEARVLFIPAAAVDEEAKTIANTLKTELLWLGFLPDNITTYELDSKMSEEMVMTYDVMYFTGGWCGHLLETIKKTGFDKIIRHFVFANKVYVGVSAGSIIATPNIMGCFGDSNNPETEGLCLINAYLDCHCNMNPNAKPQVLSLPHIMLFTHQALAVSSTGYELIEETNRSHYFDEINLQEIGSKIWQYKD